MAINPPSDIVLDVARAADPLKLQAAALKLTGAVDDDGANEFSTLVDGLDPLPMQPPGMTSNPGLIGLQTDFGAKGPQLDRSGGLSGPAMKPYREFEAFVLQSFIESMLPKDAEGIFGHGTAGEMWKGLLAEQLGKQIARAGGIGVAAKVFKAHPGDATLPSVASGAIRVGGTARPTQAPWRTATVLPTSEAQIADKPLDITPRADGDPSARQVP